MLWEKKNQPQLFTRQSQLLMTLYKRPFENIVGKGENAGYQHFLAHLARRAQSELL